MQTTTTELLRLHLTKGLGRARLLRLLRAFDSTEEILRSDPRDWLRRADISPHFAAAVPAADAPELLQALRVLEAGAIKLLIYGEPGYPLQLNSIPDPPALLYLRGELPQSTALAIVGARRASTSGLRLTRELARESAAAGLTIISGLARGVDTAAHLGALDAGSSTIAVLGCGIDQIYPPENRDLFDQIPVAGAILSEYVPGTPPLAGHFPGRNRLISGLSAGVLVVEAAEGSGSLITADFALDQGREVFAVPGNPLSPTCSGTNQLLKDGAHLVTEARDIIEILLPGTPAGPKRSGTEEPPEQLGKNEKTLFESITFEPLHIDELTRKSALTPMEVSDILLHLELAGWVEQLPGSRFQRRRQRF